MLGLLLGGPALCACRVKNLQRFVDEARLHARIMASTMARMVLLPSADVVGKKQRRRNASGSSFVVRCDQTMIGRTSPFTVRSSSERKIPSDRVLQKVVRELMSALSISSIKGSGAVRFKTFPRACRLM